MLPEKSPLDSGIHIINKIATRQRGKNEMAILTFQNIMDAQDITEETIPVPQWGGEVVVRSVSYRKMEKIKQLATEGGDTKELLEGSEVEQLLIVEGMVDPTVDKEQAKLLMEKSASAVMKVLSGIMGSSKQDEEDKAMKEEEKSFPDQPE